MDAPAITWEQARAFRLQRMHLVESLGPRSLRKVAHDLGGIQAQVHSAAGLQAAVRIDGLPTEAVAELMKALEPPTAFIGEPKA